MIDAFEANGRWLDRPWMLAIGARCRSMWLAAQGDLAGAVDMAVQAMAHHEPLPMPFELARTLLLIGQLRRRQRNKEAARHSIVKAFRTFEQLGSVLWARRGRSELARTTAGETQDAEPTPSERRAAELAASGMTTRDAAAALFISP